jgi:rod shape-determining protein MreC
VIYFPSKQRPFTLLAIVLLLQVLLLAFQIKSERDVRLVRVWAAELLTPIQKVATWTLSGLGGGWHNYIGLRHLRQENDQLHGEVDSLRLRNRELESRALEADRLAALLHFRDTHTEAPMLFAQVIGASADSTSRIVFINRGERDHLKRNFAVITPDGVVGKIVEVTANSAQVLLISDKDSGVGALFTETRTQGVVKGTGEPQLHMDYVSNEEKVRVGEAIVTSGEDRIFPKDLPLATVTEAKPGNPFQKIDVKPVARLDRLEEVIVLLSQQDISLKPGPEGPAAPPDTAATPASPPKAQQ